MRILLTGSDGYLGAIMLPLLQATGHEVTGLDAGYFGIDCHSSYEVDGRFIWKDIRDVTAADLQGFDAVIHLAALSNDPLGKLNPAWTYEINHLATVRLGRLSKEAGVRRFLYSSTCSVYGVADARDLATEDVPLRPLTPYAVSKVRAEEDLACLADRDFSPVFLRNATAYGWSPRFRADLVLNNLSCWAYTTGEIRILSDGTPWRPIVHAQDIAYAFAAALVAPREDIHAQAFNVGVKTENYQVRDLADIVQQALPGCRVVYVDGGGPDLRSYRVDFSKIARVLPGFHPAWDAPRGVCQLLAAFQRQGLQPDEFNGPRYTRLSRLNELLGSGQLDGTLRWVASHHSSPDQVNAHAG
jgi:nucleoside-diphosphate-sugar epimerase